MAAPLLHVVYCGPGDALMLEYTYNNQRRLVLIDGGPLGFIKQNNRSAPYWKYYYSAARRVWATMYPNGPVPPFKPNAIINSHADGDHFGGLLHLLEYSFFGTSPTMEFDGPFQIPAYMKAPRVKGKQKLALDPKANEAYSKMRELMMKNPGWKEVRGFEVDGLISLFPDPEDIAFFAGTGVTLPEDTPKDDLEETDDFNPYSILAQTIFDGKDGTKNMFFTGDSNGEIIAYYDRNLISGNKFSIYKVQHHGSQLDAGLKRFPPTPGSAILSELNLATLCSAGEDANFDPGPGLPDHCDVWGLRYCYARLLVLLGNILTKVQGNQIQVAKGDANAIRFRQELQARVDLYQTRANQGDDDITQLANANPSPFPLNINPQQLWRSIVNSIGKLSQSDLPYYHFNQPGVNERNIVYTESKWWTAFCKGSKQGKWLYRRAYAATASNFFKSFEADAYVISANGIHRHPNAATLVGLAKAIQASNPPRSGIPLPVYMTHGFVSKPDALLMAQQEEAINLDQVLELRVLTSDTFMTLSGATNMTSAARDIGQKTTIVRLADMSNIDQNLKQTLDTDPSTLFIRDMSTLADKSWFIQPVKDSTSYLQLDNQGVPSVVTPQAPNPPPESKVLEGWMTGLQNFNHITITQTVNGVSVPLSANVGNVQTSKDPSTQQTYRGRQIFWQSNMVEMTFYYDTNNKIQSGVWSQLQSQATVPKFVYFVFNSTTNFQAQFVEVSPDGTTSQSLADFSTSADLGLESKASMLDVLNAICGPATARGLNFALEYQKPLLSQIVDQNASSVQSVIDDINITVQNASIVASTPISSTMQLDGDALAINGATIQLTYPGDGTLLAQLLVICANGITISYKSIAQQALQPTSFRRVLALMNVDPSQLDTMCVPKVIAQILQNQQKVDDFFYKKLPSIFVQAGIASLKPDYQASSITAQRTISGEIYVLEATIVCKTSNVATWTPAMSAAGLNVVLGNCDFVIRNPSSPLETVVFQATAGFKASDAAALQLSLSAQMTGDSVADILVSVSGAKSISDVSKQLPGSPDFSALTVPFTKGNNTISTLNTTSFGFVLTQVSIAQPNYTLQSVFASTNLQDWSTFLPAGFPTATAPATISLAIVRPLDASLRAIAVDIGFAINISGALLNLTFQAIPLGGSGDYEYRLSAIAVETGFTLVDIMNAIKLGDLSGDITGAVPVLSGLLQAIHVEKISVAVEKQSSQWTFADWNMLLSLDTLVIVPNLITLQSASVDLYNNCGNHSCRINAYLSIGSPGQLLEIEFETPTGDVPGILRFSMPLGLSPSSLLRTFGLPDLSSVPVLGSVLNIEVLTASVTIGSVSATSKSWKCLGAYCSIQVDQLTVGSFDLQVLHFVLEYHTADDPLGLGQEQTIFSISTHLSDNTLSVKLSYDTLERQLLVSLAPVNSIVVRDVLAKLLPSGITNLLDPIVGGLEFLNAELVLDTDNNFSVSSFHLALSSSGTMSMKGLTLTSLTIDYRAAATLPTPLPTELTVTGVATQGDFSCMVTVSCLQEIGAPESIVGFSITPYQAGRFALSNLKQTFGLGNFTYDQPAEAPDFSNIEVINVQGSAKIMTGSSSSLTIQSLKATAQSTTSIKILEASSNSTGSIVLDELSLFVTYNGVTNVISGSISAHLKVSTVNVWCQYAKNADGDTFSGSLTLDSSASLNFESLASTISMPVQTYSVPIGIKLDLLQLNVSFVRGKSLEISGVGSTSWATTCGGVNLNVATLGALLRVSSKTGSDRTYVTYITGTLQFSGFASARMLLNVQSGFSTILQAMLVKGSNDSNQLVEVSQQVDAASKFDNLWPTSTNGLTFDGRSSLWVSADLINDKVIIGGTISNVGNALFLAKSNHPSPGNSYFFSMSASSLEKLWPALNDAAFADFSIATLCVELVSYNGTIKDLQSDIDGLQNNISEFAAQIEADERQVRDGMSPLTTLSPGQNLTPGAWLFAVIKIAGDSPSGSTSPMSDALALTADPTQSATVTLYALVTKDPVQRQYSISIQNLHLLGGSMLLQGTGIYVSATKTITATASLTVIGMGSKTWSFEVDLITKTNSTTFSLSASMSSNTKSIQCADMFNVELSSLTFDASITKNQNVVTRIYTLKGTVIFGNTGSPTAGVQGQILFLNGTPVVVSVVWNIDLDILDLFSKVIQPSSSQPSSWPSGYKSIILKQANMYYVAGSEPIKVDNTTYSAGYFVSALLSVFGCMFQISLAVQRSGIVLSGTYEGTIDLDFVRLTQSTISIDTTKSSPIYQIATAMQLFDKIGLQLKLTYVANDDSFWGSATYIGTLIGQENPQLQVQYMDGQFTIVNWPMLQVGEELIDLAKAIEEASASGSPCGKLVGLVFNKTLNDKFDLHASLVKSTVPKTLNINVTGTYTTTLIGESEPLVSVELPTLPIAIAIPSVADDVGNAILQDIKSNAANIVSTIVNDRAKLAKLFAVIATEDLTEAAVSSLLCRGVQSDLEEGVLDDLFTAAEKFADEATGDIASAATSATDALVSDGLADAVSGIAAAAGLLAGVSGTVNGLDDSTNVRNRLAVADPSRSTKLQQSAITAKQDYGGAQQKVNNARQAVCDALVLQAGSVAVFSNSTPTGDDTIHVDWSKALPNKPNYNYGNFQGVTWECVFSLTALPSGPVGDAASKLTTTSTTSQDPQYSYASNIFVYIRGTYEAKGASYIASQWTQVIASHVPMLYPPNQARIQVSSDQEIVQCTITSSSPPDGQCLVTWMWTDSVSKSTTLVMATAKATINTVTSIFTIQIPPKAMSIYAVVQYVPLDQTKQHSSPSVSSNAVLVSAAPTNLTASMLNGKIDLKWTQEIDGAPSYSIGLSKGQTSLMPIIVVTDGEAETSSVSPNLVGRSFATSVTPSQELIADGDRVTVQVRLANQPQGSVALSTTTTFTACLAGPLIIAGDSTMFDVGKPRIYLQYTHQNSVKVGGQASIQMTMPDGEVVLDSAPWENVPFTDAVDIPQKYLFSRIPKQIEVARIHEDGTLSEYSDPWTVPDSAQMPVASAAGISVRISEAELTVCTAISNVLHPNDTTAGISYSQANKSQDSSFPITTGPVSISFASGTAYEATAGAQCSVYVHVRDVAARLCGSLVSFNMNLPSLDRSAQVEISVNPFGNDDNFRPALMSTLDAAPSWSGTMPLYCWSSAIHDFLASAPLRVGEQSRDSNPTKGYCVKLLCGQSKVSVRYLTQMANTAIIVRCHPDGSTAVQMQIPRVLTANVACVDWVKRPPSSIQYILDIYTVMSDGTIATTPFADSEQVEDNPTVTLVGTKVDVNSVSSIATVSLVDGINEILWIGVNGQFTCSTALMGSGDCVHTAIGVNGLAATNSSVHARAYTNIGLWAWWTNHDGSVQAAFRPWPGLNSSSAGGATPKLTDLTSIPWQNVQVAPADSAAAGTAITSMPPSSTVPLSNQGPSIFWYGPDASIRCALAPTICPPAVPPRGYATLADISASVWVSFDQILAGKARAVSEGVRALVAYRGSDDKKYLAYANLGGFPVAVELN